MTETLLERAKNFDIERAHKTVNIEEIELAVAYVNGDVTLSQARHAYQQKTNSTNYTYRMSVAIRLGISQGMIEKLTLKKP